MYVPSFSKTQIVAVSRKTAVKSNEFFCFQEMSVFFPFYTSYRIILFTVNVSLFLPSHPQLSEGH